MINKILSILFFSSLSIFSLEQISYAMENSDHGDQEEIEKTKEANAALHEALVAQYKKDVDNVQQYSDRMEELNSGIEQWIDEVKRYTDSQKEKLLIKQYGRLQDIEQLITKYYADTKKIAEILKWQSKDLFNVVDETIDQNSERREKLLADKDRLMGIANEVKEKILVDAIMSNMAVDRFADLFTKSEIDINAKVASGSNKYTLLEWAVVFNRVSVANWLALGRPNPLDIGKVDTSGLEKYVDRVKRDKELFVFLMSILSKEIVRKNIDKYVKIAIDLNEEKTFDHLIKTSEIDPETIRIQTDSKPSEVLTICGYGLKFKETERDERIWICDKAPNQYKNAAQSYGLYKSPEDTTPESSTSNTKKKTFFYKHGPPIINERIMMSTEFLSIFAGINDLITTEGYGNTFGKIDVTIKTDENAVVLSFSTSTEGAKLLNTVLNLLKGNPWQFSVDKQGNSLKIAIVPNQILDMGNLRTNIEEVVKQRLRRLDKEKQLSKVDNASITEFPLDTHEREVVKRSNQFKPAHNKPVPGKTWESEAKNKDKDKRNKKRRNQNHPKHSANSKNTKIPSRLKESRDSSYGSKTQDKPAKSKFLDGSSYTLSTQDVDPSKFISAFAPEEKNTSESIVKINHSDMDTIYGGVNLLTIYGSLFETIWASRSQTKEEQLEIISHGISALDFEKIDDADYIKTAITNLLSMKKSIIKSNIMLEANPLYVQFKENFSSYKKPGLSSQRIAQLNALLSFIKCRGDELLDNSHAIDTVLFILGEHYARLKKSRDIFIMANCQSLFLSIKEFRNSVKHGDDTVGKSGQIIFPIGKNAKGSGLKLFIKLQEYLVSKNDSACFSLKMED